MTDDDILGPLARSAAPDLDPTSRDRIESGLRVQHAEGRRKPTGPRSARWLVAAPALVIVLLLATLALVVRDESAVAALEVRDARDVVVTLASGEMIRDPADGFALRDGAVVVVGEAGTITIGDITLDSGAVVTIRDGQLVTDVIVTTTTGRPDPPPTDTVGDGTRPTTLPPDSRPADSTPTESTPGDSRPVGTDPPREPVAPPPEVGPARDGPRDRPADADVPGDGPAVGPDGAPPHGAVDGLDVAVALSVTARDGRIRVTWSTEGTAADWTVLLLRTVDGSAPEGRGNATVVGEGPSGQVTESVADLPRDVAALRYRVVIVDGTDGVVARSEIQTLNRADS
jgi:hypothetical protein